MRTRVPIQRGPCLSYESFFPSPPSCQPWRPEASEEEQEMLVAAGSWPRTHHPKFPHPFVPLRRTLLPRGTAPEEPPLPGPLAPPPAQTSP